MLRQLPNLITLGNLLCGSVATLAVASGGYQHPAALLIIVAAFLDLFDGAAARAIGVSGPMGRELDSLADVISFGLAPTAIAFSVLNGGAAFADTLTDSVWPWLAFLLVFGAAWRLAKFNIDDTQQTSFSGLPSPANGLFWASVSAWTMESQQEISAEWIYVFILLFSYMMVAPIRMTSFKFTHLGWKGNQLRYLYLALVIPMVILSMVITGTWSVSIPVLLLLYVLFSLAGHTLQPKES